MKLIKFTIGLAPITKKNHSRIITRPNGVPCLVPSSQYINYRDSAGWYIQGRGKKIDTPLHIQYLFYMPTHRKVDLTNLEESIDDILTYYEVIQDDNNNIIVSHDGSRVLYDKENPRTEVLIEPYVDPGCALCIRDDDPCSFCAGTSFCDTRCDEKKIFEASKTGIGYCPNCGRKL